MIAYNDVLDELQDYILDENNIQKSLKMKIVRSENEKQLKMNKININNNINNINNINNNIKKPELFIPNQQDTLFWCYYIIKNGDVLYETLNNKNSLVSKQMKIDLVSIIRKNKDIVKTYKFDTITNIESNLANENNLNKKTFLTLCSIENINIIYVSKKTYFELRMNDTNIVYIIHELQNQSNYYNKNGFEMATEEKINTIRETLYRLVTIDKSIKAMSSYKVQDLIEICNKLAIETITKETGKHKSKKELYELIIQYF